ncbi:hypothetical protein C0995_012263 [Termitomyces sp. Mi166|nr:hypothetical protein C0995_012263 [Termitomyces sp. Mi166\
MPPFCALGPCGYIAIFLTLQVTWGLEFDEVPSEVNVGETMKLSWTSGPSDPETIIGSLFRHRGKQPNKPTAPVSPTWS